ncbi:unnamed protein product [Brassicogethes aeneus]|uniref:C2H2-type domain-containing protein n=1 Tax=Brassicogethes aeneus TaxID=1431903 RepID=A0A9P0B983_BRAAE|nr:unnamed protein product [Brassicogethes aeneus]
MQRMETKLISCPVCLKPHFDGVDALRSTLVNVATSNLSCPVCNETLHGLDKLTIHLFGHVSHVEVATKEQTVLEEIDKSIDSISSSEKVEEVHRRKNVGEKKNQEKNIRCDICGFCFTDQNILDMHQKLLHQTIPDKKTGIYSYHCHLCSKKFKMRGSLMVHLRVAHYGFSHDTDAPLTTNGKKKVVKSENVEENSAKVSNKQKQQDNKQWECDVCSKMFTTKYFLKKHKRLHTGEMPYTCSQCSKSFTFQQSYHKHMLYHSSEKPYVCNECGRAFKELSTLQNHARIHSGERPFGCETCGKRFRQRVSYLVHRRIHTGVMPYKCTACDKSFRYKVSQRSHKCPVSPSGNVIRIAEVSDSSQGAETSLNEATKSNLKCIMSVDYTTGNINFIPENVVFVDKNNEVIKNTTENTNNGTLRSPTTTESRDYFSMVMSPLLPEVESLCLTNNSPVESPPHPLNTGHIPVQVINDTLDKLLYNTNNKL